MKLLSEPTALDHLIGLFDSLNMEDRSLLIRFVFEIRFRHFSDVLDIARGRPVQQPNQVSTRESIDNPRQIIKISEGLFLQSSGNGGK